MNIAFLLILAALSATVLFRALHLDLKPVIYAAKPLTVVALGLVAFVAWPAVSEEYRLLILVGLSFSLVGDVLLMLPRDWFLGGLVAFLVGHLAYIAAFMSRIETLPILPFLPYVLATALVLRLLWSPAAALRIPVILYALALAAMAGSALAVAVQLGGTAWLAAAGALLFVVSDTALAFDRFVGHWEGAHYIILGTYFPAQALIAMSVLA